MQHTPVTTQWRIDMFDWFPRRKQYRIIRVPEHDYCAEFHEGLFGWLAIRPNGTTGVSHRDTVSFPNNYFVPTEAEAGARINRHATGRGQRVVWSA